MNNASINKNDEIVMKLLHYFITEHNYNPIVLHGAKDEIWLENLEEEYKIIRIVTNYIHNDEQLNFDLFKTDQIIKRIKKKTLSFNADALSIFLNLGDNVMFKETVEYDNITIVNVKKMTDLKNNEIIKESFPTLVKINKYKEKGTELFMRLTSEISKKNENDSIKAEDVFKMKEPKVTKILIAINIFIFLITYLLGSEGLSINGNTLFAFGALYKPSVLNGEIYRIITSGFLHADILHLMINMYALNIIGSQIESFYGKTKFILIYTFGLIIGSLMSLLFLGDSLSVGASGAIFGLLGSLVYFGYHYRIYLGTVIKSQIMPLIVINLLIGFLIPQINNAAHIGGLIGGTLMSVALGVKYKTKNEDKINGYIMALIFTIFLIYLNFFL
jgi:rhomboid protease GluP